MNKYTFTIIKEISAQSEVDKLLSEDTIINNIFEKKTRTFEWINILIYIELIYGIEIPSELIYRTDLTLNEVGLALSKLPRIPEAFYPEFHKLKTQMILDIYRLCNITYDLVNDGTEEERIQIQNRIKKTEERLFQITGVNKN